MRSKAAVVLPLAWSLSLAATAAGGAPAGQRARAARRPLRFEAVSISEEPPGFRPRAVSALGVGLRDPALWQAPGQPVLFTVMAAYGLGPSERDRIVGLPKWCSTELFDIEARVPKHTENAQIPAMLRAMLADRFRLRANWEERRMRAVTLSVAPGGTKMRRDPACENPNRPLAANPILAGGRPATPTRRKALACGTWARSRVNGTMIATGRGLTMRQLASLLSGAYSGLPVIDRTQLSGAFDFTLRVPFESASGLTREQMAAFRYRQQHDLEQAFRRQLGLKIDFLKPATLPVPVLVIARIEKPTPN